MLRYLLLTAGLLAASLTSRAQNLLATAATDTLRLTLPEAEQRFTQNNLSLIAQQYNVSVAQAQALQARLVDNPTVYLEQDLIGRKVMRREVPTGTAGTQVAANFQQLVSLAGRRKAAGRVAEQNAVVEQFNLQDLLRNLRYELRTSFYDLYFKQQTLRIYNAEIDSLSRTVGLYQTQYERGNVALKEVIRLKAFLFDLQTERQAILADVGSEQADLHVLLRDPADTRYRPLLDPARLKTLSLATYPEATLADTAVTVRADLRARQATVEQQNLNLTLQRKLATPDLAVGYTYDRAGSYINNYSALTLGMAVPIFNRNQGNIRAAKAQIAGAQAQADEQRLRVQAEVRQAYDVAVRADALYQNTDRNTTPFARLMEGIEKSYAKRVISVVEYLDFYEAYKNEVVQLNALRASRMRAFEQINFAVGKTVFRAE
ncbi:TolC family protein [Hymenobacter sp. ASUV-10]|uniref:TolC family protein n=1 Tax=Hymenobacter aranciens TaxID=3063996 RepID=A0ABT9BIG9_9BACT|nr:TolC family protein [Hymenobacter sp. ASUV-10]MDO7876431.1 TolC family protein [Hymenobacter sp. ASUV-10]